jgi:peptide/nickel transport system permease protein
MTARFLLGRLASMAGVLLALALALFVLQQVSPVDPVRASLGANASTEIVERERERLGYNDPLVTQYVRFVGDLARGDLGDSLRTRRPISTDLREYLPASFELAGFAFAAAGVLGLALGLASAANYRGVSAFRLALLGLASVPTFLAALVGLIVFYRWLGWLPATGRGSIRGAPTGPTGLVTVDAVMRGDLTVLGDAFRHLLLPGLCLAVGPAVAIGRILRSGLVACLSTDYARTARSKGLGETTVVVRHGLRNAAGPTLSVSGLQIGLMLAGLVIVEKIFAWPGIGLYMAQSIPASDFPAIMGVTLVLGVVFVVTNTLVDVAQAVADPRIEL